MLTDAAIARKPLKPKPFKLTDGRGLYLLVRPSGSRSWQWDYKYLGKRKTIAYGVYPDVTIPMARQRHQQARTALADGRDPLRARDDAKSLSTGTVKLFRDVAREWFGKQKTIIAASTHDRNLWLLEKRIFPEIGTAQIGQLSPRAMLRAIQTVEDRGTHYTAHRAKQLCSAIFRYAVAHGWAERDVTADLRGALTPVTVEHRAAITEPKKIGALLRAIDGLDGSTIIRAAMKLAPLVFVRPGELRTAEWAEIDLKAAIWRIPAHKMKGRLEHLVPLSTQAVAILKDVKKLTGSGRYVFPAVRTDKRPMSDGTLGAALKRLGYTSDEITPHGFRAMARTVLAEVLHADPFVIESQLAHVAPGPLGSAYNRAAYLKQRTAMLQTWADWLDTVRTAKA